MPIEKYYQNLYDLQTFEGRVNFCENLNKTMEYLDFIC